MQTIKHRVQSHKLDQIALVVNHKNNSSDTEERDIEPTT